MEDYRLKIGRLGSSDSYHYGGYPNYDVAYRAATLLATTNRLTAGDTVTLERNGLPVRTYIVQKDATLADAAFHQI